MVLTRGHTNLIDNRKVKKMDVFPYISGAVNIGLTLDADTQFDAISMGDKVYKILN